MTRPAPAPELTAEEREIVARFEAAPDLVEAWEESFGDIYTDGARVEVHEVNGGYVVVPLNRWHGAVVTALPQHACRHGWEFHPQTDDGHAHDWHMVITQPWGPKHPEHREAMTVCRVCTAPRCGHTFDDDPCIERRHHDGLHIYESGRFAAQSGMTVPPEDSA